MEVRQREIRKERCKEGKKREVKVLWRKEIEMTKKGRKKERKRRIEEKKEEKEKRAVAKRKKE